MRIVPILAVVLWFATAAHGKLVTQSVEYRHGKARLEGYLAYDDAVKGRRPGVLIVHEWWGLNDYARQRARQMAELGYVAFALDMYGKGLATDDSAKARQLSAQFKGKPLIRERAKAGLDVLAGHQLVDPKRIAAIGYCFGGTTVLGLAYSGASVAGVVSFHGGVPAPKPEDLKQIKARILVCHGGDDAFVPDDRILAFQKAMRQAKVDWQFIAYGGAVHAFTNPKAGGAGIKGVRYHERADRRSWRHMKMFFDEVFTSSR